MRPTDDETLEEGKFENTHESLRWLHTDWTTDWCTLRARLTAENEMS